MGPDNLNQDFEDFVGVLEKDLPEDKKDRAKFYARSLSRLASRHRKLQEDACNHPVEEGHDSHVRDLIRAMCKEMDCVKTVIFDGDPRGLTVRLILNSGQWNTWGGEDEGYGIPVTRSFEN